MLNITSYPSYAAEALLIKSKLEAKRSEDMQKDRIVRKEQKNAQALKCWFCDEEIKDDYYKCIFHSKVYCRKCLSTNKPNPPYPQCIRSIPIQKHKECIYSKIEWMT